MRASSTSALTRYCFLDEEWARLRQQWQRHVTVGEARREVQRTHWHHLITWIHQQFIVGAVPQTVFECLAG